MTELKWIHPCYFLRIGWFTKYPIKNCKRPSDGHHFWTSGTDISVEGKWIWESTGVNLSTGYSNWASGEPNNAENEDCLGTLSTRYPQGWLDFDCSISHEAICEANY